MSAKQLLIGEVTNMVQDMNIVRRVFFFVCMSVLCAGGFAYDIEVDGNYYNFIPDSKCVEVTYYDIDFGGYSGNVVIPDSIVVDGDVYSVTRIGNNSFYRCSEMTGIIIPESVTSIGDHAFYYCKALTDISIPNSVMEIETWAFSSCSGFPVEDGIRYADTYLIEVVDKHQEHYTIKEGTRFVGDYAFDSFSELKSIGLPNSLVSIGSCAFRKTALSEIDIPEGVISIGESAFYGCMNFTGVLLPNSLIKIGNQAFRACMGMTWVNIPESVISIGIGVFDECYALPVIDGIRYAGSYLIGPIDRKQKECKVLDGTRFIGGRAFAEMTGLTCVNLPKSVVSIGIAAFQGCKNLSEIVIPDGVTSVEYGTFSGCSSLSMLVIPDGVTSIGGYAFQNCSSLTELNIPVGVTAIEDGTFSGCWRLSSLVLPEGVTSIGNAAFFNCSSLNELKIPSGVKSIGTYAFDGCSNLSKLNIPAGVSSLDKYIFRGLSSLKTIELEGIVPPSVTNLTFYGLDIMTMTLLVPYGGFETYSNAEIWKDFGEICQVSYKITYMVDAVVVDSAIVRVGDSLCVIPDPQKEGYTFTGWTGVPEIMPAMDVVVNGSFCVNYYQLLWIVDGKVVASDSIAYGSEIIMIDFVPEKDGYTFSGWSYIPETMPASDVYVVALFEKYSGVNNIAVGDTDVYYDLSGRVVSEPVSGHIYIHKGKKLLKR